MDRIAGLACLAVLLALAGCGLPGGGTTEPPERTATPAPVPDDGTTIPGSVENRSTSALLESHRAALDGQSVTVSMQRTVHAPDETHEKHVTAYIGPDREHYHVQERRSAPAAIPDRLVWADGEAMDYRLLEDGIVVERITIRADDDRRPSRLDPADVAMPPLPLVLGSIANINTPTAPVEDGTNTTVVATLQPTDQVATGKVRGVERATLELVVAEDGHIAAYRVTFQALRDGDPVTVHYETTFEDVGSTAVPPMPFERGASTPTPD